jgi:hypothetical protein
MMANTDTVTNFFNVFTPGSGNVPKTKVPYYQNLDYLMEYVFSANPSVGLAYYADPTGQMFAGADAVRALFQAIITSFPQSSYTQIPTTQYFYSSADGN